MTDIWRGQIKRELQMSQEYLGSGGLGVSKIISFSISAVVRVKRDERDAESCVCLGGVGYGTCVV